MSVCVCFEERLTVRHTINTPMNMNLRWSCQYVCCNWLVNWLSWALFHCPFRHTTMVMWKEDRRCIKEVISFGQHTHGFSNFSNAFIALWTKFHFKSWANTCAHLSEDAEQTKSNIKKQQHPIRKKCTIVIKLKPSSSSSSTPTGTATFNEMPKTIANRAMKLINQKQTPHQNPSKQQ